MPVEVTVEEPKTWVVCAESQSHKTGKWKNNLEIKRYKKIRDFLCHNKFSYCVFVRWILHISFRYRSLYFIVCHCFVQRSHLDDVELVTMKMHRVSNFVSDIDNDKFGN